MSQSLFSCSTDKPGWLAVLLSVIAAFFGVQSRRNYQRDFTSGRYWPYIFAGLILALSFVLLVYGLVRLALWWAAG